MDVGGNSLVIHEAEWKWNLNVFFAYFAEQTTFYRHVNQVIRCLRQRPVDGVPAGVAGAVAPPRGASIHGQTWRTLFVLFR